MNIKKRVTALFFRALTGLMFRVDARALAQVPRQGPLILVANHVHIPEIPTLYTRLLPRQVRGMALAERVEKNDLFGAVLRLFETIPVHRGEADLAALRAGLATLAEGGMVLLDPEGTRSHDGRLGRGRPGAILIALHSGAPLLPVVHYGSENFKRSLRHLRREPLHFVVGRPFRVVPGSGRVTSLVRQAMIDEVMVAMARLLPFEYRGVYADIDRAPRYLKPIDP
ncbi:MAG: 1-acyl-sn-glycerol-3-phosphate acyltransferase [Anaerolineales bacterium]|nr:1-acyl-sn-glycerol-3-phosphate acyltransferase [Anaerolineales bacterium]